MLTRKELLTAAALALSLAAPRALAEPVTNVAQGQYFLSYFSAAYIDADTPPATLEAIKAACTQQQPLYVHGAAAPARCARYGSAEQNGERVAALSITGVKTSGLPLRKPLLFSLKPFAPDTWHTRPAQAEEARRVALALSGRSLGPAFQAIVDERSPEISRRLDGADVRVIESNDGKWTLYLAPWAVSEDAGLAHNNETLVLRANGTAAGFGVVANITGEVLDVVDLDGDGQVELQVSRACDGRCEAVYSLKSGALLPVIELK